MGYPWLSGYFVLQIKSSLKWHTFTSLSKISRVLQGDSECSVGKEIRDYAVFSKIPTTKGSYSISGWGKVLWLACMKGSFNIEIFKAMVMFFPGENT